MPKVGGVARPQRQRLRRAADQVVALGAGLGASDRPITSPMCWRVVGSSVITATSTSCSRVSSPRSGAAPMRHQPLRLSNIRPRVPSIGSTSKRNGGPPRPATPNSTPPVDKPSPTTVKCCSRPTLRSAAAAALRRRRRWQKSCLPRRRGPAAPSSRRPGPACVRRARRGSPAAARAARRVLDGRAWSRAVRAAWYTAANLGALARVVRPACRTLGCRFESAGLPLAGAGHLHAAAAGVGSGGAANVVGRRRGSAREPGRRAEAARNSVAASPDRYGGGRAPSLHASCPRARGAVRRSLRPGAARGFDVVDHEIELGVLPGQLRFDKETLAVAPGSKVKLTLVTPTRCSTTLCCRSVAMAWPRRSRRDAAARREGERAALRPAGRRRAR